MLSQFEIENNLRWESTEMCKKCKGHCCQQMACFCSPDDFDNDVQKMYEALNSGNYSIDFLRKSATSFRPSFNGAITLNPHSILLTDGEALLIRPRNKNKPIVDILHKENEVEGPCIFWSLEYGCALPYEKRPKFGRATIAHEPGNCKCYFSNDFIAKEWKPYTFDLYEFARKMFPPSWVPYKKINLKL